MGRKETGFFRSLYNAVTGTGETVRHTTDFWGNRRTVVHDYDTGTRKTYTHKKGVFSDRTDVRVERHGKTVGKGSIKKDVWGRSQESIDYSHGPVRRSVKKYNRGFFGNRDETVQYDSSGNVIGRRKGKRSLLSNNYSQQYEGTCFCCNGTGIHRSGNTCRKCGGSGVYRKP